MNFGKTWPVHILLVFIYQLCRFGDAFEVSFTIEVRPSVRECFHQAFTLGSTYEVDYQVIEGGDMDINFYIQSPSGRVLVSEIRKTDSVHKLDVLEEGDYGICFDNSFSRFSSKYVFFEVISDDPDPTWDKPNLSDESEEFQAMYELKLQDVWATLDRMKSRMDKSRSDQQTLRIHELRHRSVAEANFTRVNFWSSIQLSLMISVGMLQVFLIRQLFEDRGRVSKLLKMKT